MDVGARRAGPADVPILTELARAAIAELTPHRGGSIWARLEARSEPIDQGLEAQIDDDASMVAVGTIDGTVVGYAAAAAVELHHGPPMAALSDLFVLAEARGVGVGEALMILVFEWAADEGFIGVDSVALPGDRATKNFFESFGMVARALSVHRSL